MKNVEHLDTVNTNLHEVLGENETLNDAAIGASGSNLNNATTTVMPEKSSQQHTLAVLSKLHLLMRLIVCSIILPMLNHLLMSSIC